MSAPKGNQFWKFRTKHGRDYKYQPDELWEECLKYFQWCQDNPLYEEKVFHKNGVITKTEVAHMRAMTMAGLCYYLKMSDETWYAYKKLKDFAGVIREAERIMYEQKFAGAAAELLNANIIARDLGLRDKQALDQKSEITGKDGGPVEWNINFKDTK